MIIDKDGPEPGPEVTALLDTRCGDGAPFLVRAPGGWTWSFSRNFEECRLGYPWHLMVTGARGSLDVIRWNGSPRGNDVVSPRAEVLREAEQLITGDRNLSYGTPTQNFQNTADLWNVQIGHKLKEPITSTDVAILMTHLKLARLIASGTKRDNYADAIGYMACAWETVVADEPSE